MLTNVTTFRSVWICYCPNQKRTKSLQRPKSPYNLSKGRFVNRSDATHEYATSF